MFLLQQQKSAENACACELSIIKNTSCVMKCVLMYRFRCESLVLAIQCSKVVTNQYLLR